MHKVKLNCSFCNVVLSMQQQDLLKLEIILQDGTSMFAILKANELDALVSSIDCIHDTIESRLEAKEASDET